MRLNAKEQSAIKGVLSKFDPEGKVYLFGSRTDDEKRGGDIDLLFETQRPITLKEELRARYQLELACDGRVDLIIKLKDAPPDPIHLIAISYGVVL
jgi:predicted nucleotidyltransferase